MYVRVLVLSGAIHSYPMLCGAILCKFAGKQSHTNACNQQHNKKTTLLAPEGGAQNYRKYTVRNTACENSCSDRTLSEQVFRQCHV